MAVAEARATTEAKAHTFALACRCLPRAVRDDVHLLYFVFRTLDDFVDEQRPGAERRVAAVDDWARSRRGEPTREVAILEYLARRHELPRRAFADFCQGMRHDLERASARTEADVDRYCYQVAGTVGLTMAAVLGVRERSRALPAAAALGMAMQRTNILRDIDEDLESGRVFVAREAIDRFGGLEPGRRSALLRDQIARADVLYDEGCVGISLLLRGRRAVAAAAGMYREILRQIERDGYGARPGRAVVSGPRKLALATRYAVAAR